MVLWEIRSYPDALARERARLLALTTLQDTYGRLAWRWRAPRRERALYRLGELAPAAEVPAIEEPSTDDDPLGEHVETAPKRRTVRTASARRSGGRRRGRVQAPDVEDLMPLGRRIAAELDADGRALTRDSLAAGLRAAGHTAGNARAGALLTRLRTEPRSDQPTTDDSSADTTGHDSAAERDGGSAR